MEPSGELWPQTRQLLESLGFTYVSEEHNWGPKLAFRRGDLLVTIHFHNRDVWYYIEASHAGDPVIDLVTAARALGADEDRLSKIFWQRLDDDVVTRQFADYVLEFVESRLDSDAGRAELSDLVQRFRQEVREKLQLKADG